MSDYFSIITNWNTTFQQQSNIDWFTFVQRAEVTKSTDVAGPALAPAPAPAPAPTMAATMATAPADAKADTKETMCRLCLHFAHVFKQVP